MPVREILRLFCPEKPDNPNINSILGIPVNGNCAIIMNTLNNKWTSRQLAKFVRVRGQFQHFHSGFICSENATNRSPIKVGQ